MGNNKNYIDFDKLAETLGIEHEKTIVDLSPFENMPSYTFIEGIYIQDNWKNHKDYPEPPDEKELATEESKKIYESYRSELEKFSLSRIEEWRVCVGR